MEKSLRNTVIIGAGPAGYTAAIYLGRANLKPLLLTGVQPGGQLTTTTEIENFPGFSRGIPGPRLMEEMLEQARRAGAEIRLLEEATGVDVNSTPYAVLVDQERIETRSILIATGASPRTLGVPAEKKYWSRVVHTCAVCDGAFYRDKEVAVVGGGDSAMEEAHYLANLCAKVTVIHRRGELRASKVMQERVLAHPRIEMRWFSVVEDLLGEGAGLKARLRGLRLRDTRSGETDELAAAAVFFAIGHIPNTAILRGVVDLDDEGYVKVDDRLRASREGVFAAGDVHDRRYRQAITAAGFGCRAALEIERWLVETGKA